MAKINNTDSTILPYNDDNAYYDIDKRRYILTSNGLKSLVGVDIEQYVDSPSEVEYYLDEFSLDVYDYIYMNSMVSTVPLKRFLLAKEPSYRTLIIEAMALNARGGLRSGSFLLKDQHGVNIEKGKVIDLKYLRGEVAISGSCLRSLERDKNLLYTGTFSLNSFYDDGTY